MKLCTRGAAGSLFTKFFSLIVVVFSRARTSALRTYPNIKINRKYGRFLNQRERACLTKIENGLLININPMDFGTLLKVAIIIKKQSMRCK